ncbi:MAG: hypothetical protein PHP98_00425 [Kiritimatiellae bacterium]|nr:hypothetical protein [Kiritimatiellia bacterium]
MTRFREIIAGPRSCFTLTPHERLVIILVMAIFLFGLFLRWRHLSKERAETCAPAGRATNELPTP